MKEKEFRGIPASWGIGLGKVVVVSLTTKEINDIKGKEAEEALQNAKDKTIMEIDNLVKDNTTDEIAGIFNAHKLMVEAIVDEALEIIRKGQGVIEAITSVVDKYKKLLEASESTLIQLRADDLIDIKNSLIENLTEEKMQSFEKGSVLVLEEIYPSQLLKYAKQGVEAIVSEKGSYTSHAAIIARSLGIPAVFGVRDATKFLKNQDFVIVDGFSGVIVVNPDEETLKQYKRKKETLEKLAQKFKEVKKEPAITIDGRRILVTANIGNEDDLNTAIMNGCDGVGLFRMEFYYLTQSALPSSDKLVRIFEKFAKKLKEKPLTIRLLDIGGDKPLPYIPFPEENNPFLGFRGIRYLLKHKDLLESQLRAVLITSRQGNIRVMAPMVSTIEEVRDLKRVIKTLSEEVNGKLKVGIMVEVPSIVFMVDKIAKEVDFLSIGTNDLTQYIFAADRTNENVSYLYDDMHPVVLKAIKEISEKAHNAGTYVDVCGELASNPLAIPILVGLGIDELSVSPTAIPMAKWIIRNISYEDAKKLAENVIELENGEEVRKNVRKFLRENLNMEIPW
jgi:phosphotransferase system enzyme I (PtsI)